MGFKDLLIKYSYDSDFDDILNDFYIPVLSESVQYYRLAGYFTSNSLAIASRGMSNFILNGGEMKLICGANLEKNDWNMIKKAKLDPQTVIAESMINDLKNLEEGFVKNHVEALGWMIAKNKLEIKIAIPIINDDDQINLNINPIFHQKIGILKDIEGNMLSFSGSNNETLSGWKNNIEEFKVFRNWDINENEYFKSDLKRFEKFWEGFGQKIDVIDLPEVIKEQLIKIAPSKPFKKNLKKKKIKLWDYQKEAINNWINNDYQGIFEMATGTGKTFTALGCLKQIFDKNNQILVVVTCPYQHLTQQWKKEVEKFGLSFDKIIVADGSNKLWKDDLVDSLIELSIGDIKTLIIFTTHRTFSSSLFIDLIQDYKEDFESFLIADEVHGLGAEISSHGLIDKYDKRLGLSATPQRWFDLEGTEEIYNYFGGVIFEFSLEKAINTINPATDTTYLTPYEYMPKFVCLDNEELDEYLEVTKNIAFKYAISKKNHLNNQQLKSLIFKRANIIKNAVNKFVALEQILDEIGSNSKWIIIYCSNTQINRVMEILNNRRITAHRFTMDEDTKPDNKYNGESERDYLIKKFASADYSCLVAMKCLDEGVDIPPARIAILMSSSGNPREYIQRIGRIIRKFEDKEKAQIYDIIALPPLKRFPAQIKDFERDIFKKEEFRFEEIAKTANNNIEALKQIFEVKRRFGV